MTRDEAMAKVEELRREFAAMESKRGWGEDAPSDWEHIYFLETRFVSLLEVVAALLEGD